MHSPFHTSCITDPRLAKGEKPKERTNRVELDGNPRRSRSDKKGRETTELSRLMRRRFRQLRNSKALSLNLVCLESLLATKKRPLKFKTETRKTNTHRISSHPDPRKKTPQRNPQISEVSMTEGDWPWLHPLLQVFLHLFQAFSIYISLHLTFRSSLIPQG